MTSTGGFDFATMFWLASLSLRSHAAIKGVRDGFCSCTSGAELAELSELMETGELSPVIDCVFPF